MLIRLMLYLCNTHECYFLMSPVRERKLKAPGFGHRKGLMQEGILLGCPIMMKGTFGKADIREWD